MRLPRRVLAGAGALAIDAALGEPPRLHPVVGMGNLLAALRRRSRAEGRAGELAEGAAGAGRRGRGVGAHGRRGAARCSAACRPGRRCSARRERSRRCSPCAGCASPSRAYATRSRPAISTRRARGAARDLVSRDTSQLDAGELSGAAIQSLAENLSDSVVAPLLAYAAGGLPAAAAYRALNTADAMWGYRTPEYLYRGRAAARADDVANLIPGARDRALHRGALAAARAPRCGRRCATTGRRRRPTAAGRWRPWPAGSACASPSAAPTRSTPRRASRRRPTSARALEVVGG